MDEYGLPDLDDPGARALEVSGKDRGPIGDRMQEKRVQLLRGGRETPGVAAVVGFARAIVGIQNVEPVTE